MSDLARVPIHVAKTRPAMKFGLPLELLVVLMVLSVNTGVLAGLYYMVLWVPVWWGASMWVRKDYNAPRLTILWFRGAALDFESRAWGGVSVNPMPQPGREFRGIKSPS